MKRIFTCILVLTLCITLFASCGKKHEYTVGEKTKIELKSDSVVEVNDGVKTKKENIKVKFEIEDMGDIVMELYPQYAPETVSNFCDLVNEDFYTGITFHRVIPGFMAQAGDPTGTGTGGSDVKIKGEFKSNGFGKNTLKHERGTVSMARTNDPDSASSQFFIMHQDKPHLDGDYAAFGYVTEGIEVVDAICANTKVEDKNGSVKPENQPVITSITVID